MCSHCSHMSRRNLLSTTLCSIAAGHTSCCLELHARAHWFEYDSLPLAADGRVDGIPCASSPFLYSTGGDGSYLHHQRLQDQFDTCVHVVECVSVRLQPQRASGGGAFASLDCVGCQQCKCASPRQHASEAQPTLSLVYGYEFLLLCASIARSGSFVAHTRTTSKSRLASYTGRAVGTRSCTHEVMHDSQDCDHRQQQSSSALSSLLTYCSACASARCR